MTIEAPLVSLLMAAWRPRREWLLAAVGSLLGQDYRNIELIVVDDGSPQPIAELLAGVHDPRVRVVRIEHGGEVAARNAGIARARGELLRFVDADDVYERAGTRRLVELAAAHPGAIAYGATVFCDEALRPIWTMRSRRRGRVAEECLLGRFGVRIPSMLLPRTVVEAAGEWDAGFDGVNHDLDFLLRALEHAPVAGTRAPVTRYRKHGGGATRDFAAGERGRRRVLRRYFERHPERRGGPLERRAEAGMHALEARVRLTHGMPRAALRRLVASLALDPSAAPVEAAHAAPALVGHARHGFGRVRSRA